MKSRIIKVKRKNVQEELDDIERLHELGLITDLEKSDAVLGIFLGYIKVRLPEIKEELESKPETCQE